MSTPTEFPHTANYPKKRRVWPWVLGGVLGAVILACVAGVTLIGGAATVVKHEQISQAADVKLVSCKRTVIDTIEVGYTITNSSKTARSYTPTFKITANGATVADNAADYTPSIAPGATFKGKAISMLNDESATKITCSVA